ncbi:MAG: phosphatase PAP2 family protein [Gemmatimonadetes bacterium]|nr:phosphatase PAP2 family protein [Gemmatimonadota bacterium]
MPSVGLTMVVLLALAWPGSDVSAQSRSDAGPWLLTSTGEVHSATAGASLPLDTVPAPSVRLFEWRFVGEVALGTAGSLVLVPLDGRVRSWMQDPARQGSAALDRSVSVLTPFGSAVPLAASAALYGAGLLTGSRTAADVGLHVSEGMLGAVAVTTFLKILVGRPRPYVDPHDPNAFGRGRLIDFESRLESFPSGHATVAFAFAGALTEETAMHWPRGERFVGPVTFATAVGVAFARMYRDKHWASDVLAGAVVGTLVSRRVVRSLHTGGAGPFSRLDPILLPRGSGGTMAGFSIAFHRGGP